MAVLVWRWWLMLGFFFVVLWEEAAVYFMVGLVWLLEW